ncbi:PKD domain-containing protein [Pleionea sp. CnH1-48]|uniref:PKD domain-containing protein n=1 Tax=Pleionea sp. CnH1-48 TaxID=2954494 RepID=UPI002098476D|nr:PKD domain-containing protein [Pleionea sp. CnH1-48]MCO7225580.1 PKD domain-containing protein [Pleionea sp. CnH1-48]
MRNATHYLKLLCIQLCLIGPLFAGEKVNESIDLAGNRQATWYLPDNAPNGWILLQHGFQRNKSNLDDLATHLMDNGLMVLTINSSVTGGNANLAKSVADALVDNPPTPPNNIPLPAKMIVAGHSAGALFVSHMGGQLVQRGYAPLQGAILFDPVDANDGMQTPLQSMLNNGNPVLSILANSSSCNSSNNALQPLRALTDAFVGIKLTNDSKHTDVEGSSTGGIITWLCGTPKTHNINYLQDFALHWAKDMLSGTVSADYYPGGSKIQQLLDDNDGILIKELTTQPPTADFSFSASELSVQFTNSSSDDGNIVSYNWQFGDGSSSTQESPSHQYNAAGTYTVTLTVTDDDGQTGNASKNVTVVEDSAAPSASFTYVKNNLTVDFSDTSSDSDGSIASWSWSFGDGSTSNQANPSHTFNAAGSYDVTLEVTDNDGLTDSNTQTVSVIDGDDGLENGASISDLSAARNDALYFKMNVPANARDLRFAISGGSGDADIYVRYGAVPTTSQYDYRPYKNGNNETVDIPSPQGGVWHLMVRAYRAYSGVTLTASYLTSDNQAPTASFNVNTSGLSASFTDTSSDVDGSIASRLWTFGDGTQSTDANPTHSYAQAGSYNVTLAVTDDDGATNSVTQSIEVSTDDNGPTELINGNTVTDLSASTGEELHYVLKNVPADTAELRFLIEGGSGDADIYIRYGAAPTTSEYDHRPYRNGNYEPVNISSPQSGNWYVMVRAYRTFSGVNLSATHTVN